MARVKEYLMNSFPYWLVILIGILVVLGILKLVGVDFDLNAS